MIEIRIAWKIGQASGHGDWVHTNNREYFLRAIKEHCEEYGKGTHWLEEREA